MSLSIQLMQYIPFILLAKYKETPRVFEEKKLILCLFYLTAAMWLLRKLEFLYHAHSILVTICPSNQFDSIVFFFLAIQGVQYWLQMPADMKVKYCSEVDIKKIKTH